MTANALRQGARLGVYPQRDDEFLEPLEKFGQRVRQRLRDDLTRRDYSLNKVAGTIRNYAEPLALLDDEALQQRRDAITYNLAQHGLEDDLIHRAFALVSEYARRSLHMRYYDVQLFGAWAIVKGNCAQMATGEGKTFTASLAAATAALAGIPVHVITTNEYLAQRDAQEMAPLYQALGLSVNTVLETMQAAEKRGIYKHDIVYCTNKQVAFDYLRDRMLTRDANGRVSLKFSAAHQNEQLVLRGLCFGIVDEADSVLIDEARTPLILSREHRDDSQQEIYQDALALAKRMQADKHYVLHTAEHRLHLTESGKHWLEQETTGLTGIWAGTRHSEFLVHQALCALHLFLRDRQYLVRDNNVEIIDANTGRTMADRSWQKGLQQMVECKEGCAMTGQRETLAGISYQRFFSRYLYLGGMSGTLGPCKDELRSVYGQRVINVPTHRPNQRNDKGITLHLRTTDKWLAVAKQVKRIHRRGRPVLVGTASLRESELLTTFLQRQELQPTVLNARQDEGEAEIVAQAGEYQQITVATNMAGRGTDIKLGSGVAEVGGLHVISTSCHEEQRVDQQLMGRCARQGDPGSTETHISLEDPLLVNFYPPKVMALLTRAVASKGTLPQWLIRRLVRSAQYGAARRHRLERLDVMALQEKLEQLLAFSGSQE
ncbi:MAG: DEAD/DEAH box helicase [Halioglobus sp.]